MGITAKDNKRIASDGNASLVALTDEQLLIAYRDSGDRGTFALLVERYERELFNYLKRYLGNAEMAEDAFQGAFLQVHLKCEQFQDDRKFRPWLYTIATNQAIDLQRRNRRHRMVSLDRSATGAEEDVGKLIDLMVSDEPSPLAATQEEEQREWIRERLEELPEGLRAVVVLVYYQGMKYREAAEVLDIPVGTVKSRLHAAIYKLHEAWDRTHVEQ